VFALEGLGGLLGSVLPSWSLRRFGMGRTLVVSTATMGAASVLFPLATGPVWAATLLLGGGLFFQGLSSVVYRVQQLSLRQLVTPAHLRGRINASTRFLTWGMIPLGALAGGALGQATSLRMSVGVGALGCALSFLWLIFSPVVALRDLRDSGTADARA
jgi:predicted MFS family arabinose efflux permease